MLEKCVGKMCFVLEFPGGRRSGEIGYFGECVGKVCGKMERYLYSIVIIIVFFSMSEKSKMTLKNRKLFDII